MIETQEDLNAQAARLEIRAAEANKRSQESFEQSDTDGFLSQYAADSMADLYRVQAQILRDGKTSMFPGLYQGDRRVGAKIINTKFGCTWLLNEEETMAFGRKFIPSNSIGKPGRIQKQLGLIERWETAPAWARHEGMGGGMVYIQEIRTGCQWGSDAVLIREEAPHEPE